MMSFSGKGYPELQVNGILDLFKLIDNDDPGTNQVNLSVYKTLLTRQEPTSLRLGLQNVVQSKFKQTGLFKTASCSYYIGTWH